MTATLTKVGNSAAVLIPSRLRQQAGIDVGDECTMDSPRRGVLVIDFTKPRKPSRLERILQAEERIHELNRTVNPWEEGMTADDLIEEARAAKAQKTVESMR